LISFQGEGLSHQHELQLRSNTYWLNYLSTQYYNQEPVADLLDYSKRLENITATVVQATAQKIIDRQECD